MADYRNAICPNCGTVIGKYRIDILESVAHGYCRHCHERYTVVHGNGGIKVVNK